MAESFSVAIVGAGFSGTAVALQLLRRLPAGARVLLLERSASFGRGLAYGTTEASHVLNVPAGRLGWDPDHEAGFIDWLRARGEPFAGSDFVPRGLLGEYLDSELQRAAGPALERRSLEVLDLEREATSFRLSLADGSQVRANQVVLCTGFSPPVPPAFEGARWNEPGWIANPWAPGALSAVPARGPVLVLGSALTAIDLVTWLEDRGHQRPITLLSRRGLLPQAHRTHDSRPPIAASPLARLGEETSLRKILRAVRTWTDEAHAAGGDWRDVLVSLRSSTPELWQRLSLGDRRRFLRHLVPYWDTHRHRVAPQIDHRLRRALDEGRVELHAGRMVAVERLGSGALQASWRPRGSRQLVTREFVAIVNCTGASTGLSHAGPDLLSSLREAGLLTVDALNLGLQLDDRHRPLGQDGAPTERLYYLGPMLKAQRWEAIAIPELRRHAREVAEALTRSRPS